MCYNPCKRTAASEYVTTIIGHCLPKSINNWKNGKDEGEKMKEQCISYGKRFGVL